MTSKKIIAIKTECGIEKMRELQKKKGLVARLRLFWFIFTGSLRDINK